MKIYPVPGGEGLRDPRTRRRIPADGLEVPGNNFWNRRVVQGDVTLEPSKAPATKNAEQTAS